MVYQLRKLKRKRQYESDCEPKSKQRKLRGIKNPVNATDAEAITNICYELIDQIFDFLDPQSLLNVAGTCKRLQIAAAAKYKRKFGRYIIKLFSNGYYEKYCELNKGIQFEREVIDVYGTTILPFLRCYGEDILTLQIYGTLNKHVICYINQYCADTLKTIRIHDMDKENFAVENFQKPFKMVEVIEIGNLGKQFSDFAVWFPNMRSFLCYTKSFDFDVSSAAFPHLEKLQLIGRSHSRLDNKQIQRFLHANQQLKSLKIWIQELQFSKLLDMIGGNAVISNLQVRNHTINNKYVRRTQLLRFAREHHMMVDLDLMPYLFKADDTIALICELKSLKSFQFQLKDLAECRYLVHQLRHVMGFKFKTHLSRVYLPLWVLYLKFDR